MGERVAKGVLALQATHQEVLEYFSGLGEVVRFGQHDIAGDKMDPRMLGMLTGAAWLFFDEWTFTKMNRAASHDACPHLI